MSCLECGEDEQAQKGACVKLAKCSPGEYSGTGFHPCKSCEAGYSNQLSGATVCTACEPGKVAVGAGLALCSSCPPNSVAGEGAFQCTECDSSRNEVPDKHQGACVKCSDGEKASNGVCLELSSQDSAIQGVFANSGLPFYILVIIALAFACLGVMVYYDKTTTELLSDGTTEDMKRDLVQQSLFKHVLQIFFASSGLVSEFILAYYLCMTKVGKLLIPAALMFAARLVIAPYPL